MLAPPAAAQVKVTGRVTNLENNPVSDVVVKIMTGNKTLAFTSSNVKGEYALELKSAPKGEVTLLFNHISYEKQSETLALDKAVTRMDMVLTPKSIALKEVTVKASPLKQRGDTLTHYLPSFLGKGDVTLEDGLKRLPGVDVSGNGAISYMGRPISQFNIEGLDMLGGKYSLATQNIPADYVTNVEIVRNHHSRKVDSDTPSNEVSMNIKLSKKAKMKPFGQEEAGAGYMDEGRDRLQALLGVTGMVFTDKMQSICSLKGGNYKRFAQADMVDHFGGSGISTPATSLFGGFDGGSPPQGEYLYQRNGMATVNGIQKIDSVTTLKVNADYSYNRATHDICQISTYLAGEGNYVTVSEQTSPLSKTHMPKLSVNYLKNAARVYLSETFVVKGKFESNEGDVTANGQDVEQRRKTSSFQVSNSLSWTSKTAKGTSRNAYGSVSFKRTPTLRLSFVSDGQAYGQTAQSTSISLNTGTSVSIPFGKTFKLNLPIRISASWDDVLTNRTATGETNDIHGWALTPSTNLGFEVHSRDRRFFLSAGVGAALKGLYYNKLNYTKPVINPSMGMTYTFSANSKVQVGTGYQTQIGDMMSLLTEPMQTDYRTSRASSGIIGKTNTWRTSGMQYFTLALSASHSESKRNTLYAQTVSGIDVSNSALRRDTRSRSTDFNIRSTKSIPSIFTKLAAEAAYGFGNGEQAISSGEGTADIIKTRSNDYSLHGNASVAPFQWIELRYDIHYGWSRTRYADERNTVTSLSHQGAIHVFPVAALDLSFDYDHTRRQISTDRYKHMSLFNASAQYKWKRCVLRLECTNLLNQRSYSYTVYDGINTYNYDYGLCGRTVMLRTTFKM